MQSLNFCREKVRLYGKYRQPCQCRAAMRHGVQGCSGATTVIQELFWPGPRAKVMLGQCTTPDTSRALCRPGRPRREVQEKAGRWQRPQKTTRGNCYRSVGSQVETPWPGSFRGTRARTVGGRCMVVWHTIPVVPCLTRPGRGQDPTPFFPAGIFGCGQCDR
jgi:hypothetical protein